jgi:RIO kinase 1
MSDTQRSIDQLEPLTSLNEAKPEVEEQVSEEEDSWSSDSEIADALDWLDTRNDDDSIDSSITLNSRRPNAHGGLHSRPNSSTFQPLSNRNQKFSHHIRASPLEVLI